MFPRTVMTGGSLLFNNMKSNLKGQHKSSSAALSFQLTQQWITWFWQNRFLGTAIRRKTWGPLRATAWWPLWLAGTMNMVKYTSTDGLVREVVMEERQLLSTANRLCFSFPPPRRQCYRLCCTSGFQQLTAARWELKRTSCTSTPQRKSEGLQYAAK